MDGLKGLAEEALSLARDRGALEADLWLSSRSGLSRSLREGKLELEERSEEVSLDLRVRLDGDRWGSSHASGSWAGDLERVVEGAMENARLSEPDPDLFLADGDLSYPDPSSLGIFDEEMSRLDGSSLEDFLQEVVSLSLGDPHVRSLREASLSVELHYSVYASTQGLLLDASSTSAASSVALVLERDGEMDMAYFSVSSRSWRGLSPKALVEGALRRGLASLGGRPILSGRFDLVLDSVASAELLSTLLPSLLASRVYKKKSLFVDRLGEVVASAALSLEDDGLLFGGVGSFPFDGEGYPCGRTPLLEEGRLLGYLTNLKYARLMGLKPTGNASRGGVNLGISPSNLLMRPGRRSLEEIKAESRGALYVTSFMGLHTADPISGEFSVGAKGALLDGGELKPVSGIAVSGNLKDLIGRIREVASDREFLGGMGVCPLVLEGVDVAGV